MMKKKKGIQKFCRGAIHRARHALFGCGCATL
jgi:hypothetical protein